MTSRMLALILALSCGFPAMATPTGEPLGRCCFLGIVPDPVLCDVLTEEECLSLPAPVSWTEGEDCEGDPCNEPPVGRCCFLGIVPDPVLCDVTTEEDCLSLPAPVSWTEGADCEGDPCNDTCAADCAPPPDGLVTILDLLAMLAQWGGPGSCDTNDSGTVDILDLLTLLAQWGECPGDNAASGGR